MTPQEQALEKINAQLENYSSDFAGIKLDEDTDREAIETILAALQSQAEKDRVMKAMEIALGHYINADAYAATFPDNEDDYKYLKKQETWNRLQARTFLSDELRENCSQAYKGHYAHKWDKDGERCVKCGDKDWMNSPICMPKSEYTKLGGTQDE